GLAADPADGSITACPTSGSASSRRNAAALSGIGTRARTTRMISPAGRTRGSVGAAGRPSGTTATTAVLRPVGEDAAAGPADRFGTVGPGRSPEWSAAAGGRG